MFCPRYFFGGRHFCTNSHGIHWMIGAIFVISSQLIFMKIIKIVATRYHQNAPNLISARAAPQTLLETLQRSPDPLARFKGPTSKERRGERWT